MVGDKLEIGEAHKIDNETAEFRVTKIYADSWERGYDIFDVMTGLRLVPVAIEEKRLDANIAEELRTYRLKTGYYALVEIVKYYSIKDAIAIPGISGPAMTPSRLSGQVSPGSWGLPPLWWGLLGCGL